MDFAHDPRRARDLMRTSIMADSPVSPTIRTFQVFPDLPAALQPLLRLANNLWWCLESGRGGIVSAVGSEAVGRCVSQSGEAARVDLAGDARGGGEG
jgi:hypothetical protein